MLTFTPRPEPPGARGSWEVGRAADLAGLAFLLGAMVCATQLLRAYVMRLQDRVRWGA